MSQPTWYLKNVKEKENRAWSEGEKLRIYNLRMAHEPVAIIAQRFNATLTQIHNITRLAKKGLKQQCYHCGNPLTDKEANTPKTGFVKACNKCKKAFLEYKTGRREQALKQHLCGVCETRPVLKGRKACKECISATYRRRIKEGLCGRCGKMPIHNEDGGLCIQCLSIMDHKTV